MQCSNFSGLGTSNGSILLGLRLVLVLNQGSFVCSIHHYTGAWLNQNNRDRLESYLNIHNFLSAFDDSDILDY